MIKGFSAEKKYLTDEERKNESLVAGVVMATLEQYGRALLDCGCEIGETTVLPTIKVVRKGWCFNTYPDYKGRYHAFCNACVKYFVPENDMEVVSIKSEFIPGKKEECGCDTKCDNCSCEIEVGKC